MSNEITVVKNQSLFTVRKIVRILSLLCTVFVFCPSFLVSCSNQVIEVGVMTAVEGMTMYGETVVEPQPIMLLCLLIPIAMFVLLFIRKFTNRIVAAIVSACATVDLIIWVVFRETAKKMVEENYCTMETTPWYVINIIVLAVIIVLSVLVVVKMIEMDTDLARLFSNGDTQEVLNKMSDTMSQMSSVVTQLAGEVATNVKNKSQKEKAIGYCAKCGNAITYGIKFCTACGTAVPESMIIEAENAKEAEEEAKLAEEKLKAVEEMKENSAEIEKCEEVIIEEKGVFCVNCGAVLEPDAVFCVNCGTKVE